MLFVAHWIAAGNITMTERFGATKHLLPPHRHQHASIQHDVVAVEPLVWPWGVSIVTTRLPYILAADANSYAAGRLPVPCREGTSKIIDL